jgi:hypothetical protein
MAISEVSAADQDTIGTFSQSVDNEVGMDHSRAHYPYDSQVRQVLDPRSAREIGSGIRTPVAAEAD